MGKRGLTERTPSPGSQSVPRDCSWMAESGLTPGTFPVSLALEISENPSSVVTQVKVLLCNLFPGCHRQLCAGAPPRCTGQPLAGSALRASHLVTRCSLRCWCRGR